MPPSASSKLSRAQILRSLKSSFKKSQHKLQSKLADDIFYNVDTQDIRDVGGENLTKIVDSATKALAKKGSTISIDPAVGGRSLITVCMKNRPFIVDSTLAVLTEQGQDIELIAHPVVNLGDKTPTLAEKRSLVFIIMRTPDQSKLKTLKSKLKETLGQVRLLTDDWRKMLAVVDETINRYRTNPPPLPSDQLAEGIQFLEWLCDENFTFMGMRYYGWPDKSQSGDLIADHKTALGILKDANLNIMTRNGSPVVVTDEIRAFLNSETPLIITKANMKTNVHRRAYLDYVGIKQYDDIGNLIGELRLVGLFTSSAYTRSVMRIPYLRHKANGVLRNYRADPTSHSGKALVNILETWPRDELFQIEPEQLHAFAGVAVRLEERPRVRVLPRVDRFDRFVSVIVYVPRERYDSKARLDIGAYLAKAYQGRVSAWYPQFLENGLTRVHFIIGRDGGTTPVNSSDVLEAEINNITRNWDDAFSKLEPKSPPDFSAVYQERFDPEQALADTEIVNGLQNDTEIAVDFNLADGDPSSTTLKLFHLGSSIPLSRRVPLLENMGFHAIDELSYQIERTDGETVHLHEMRLRHKALPEPADESLKERLTECLLAIWNQRAENDRFNGLVLTAGFSWSEALIFRAYSQYLRQIGSQFTLRSMAQTLITLSTIAGQLSQLFDVRLNPATTKRDDKEQKLEAKIFGGLESVTSSDDDRIIRNFVEVLNATLRTNLYQPDFTPTKDVPAPILAFKFDPAAISIMPKPVPYREIFVSSPRVEGLHLRFGPVARGGLRWSDRALDYRTEVLGLVKAQQVKNAVIVPVGSKGGFLPKQLPKSGDRNAWFQEGHSSYKIFISSLLSVTDNLVDGKVVPPPQTVRHDGDDPYFVVAADKGTSTFSDTANAISQGRDFWLDDAFASGGSAGYDHKKMGITARGGWEAVKRHFREMDRDIQTQPFTAIGVGDMSGDVFGNGMLLSKQTRLIAAFDHRDIFIDPNPDAKSSFKERLRIFKLDRSSWQDYDTKLLSKGGGIFPRASKSIKISKEIAACLDINTGEITPNDLMRAILKSNVDLMWFGGIGTYIKAGVESDAEVGDRANDAIRVMSKEVRAKVVGEGANLGMTQDARIAFNLLGGRCNSDAIDNSAGVNSSDVEVNIKIALAAAMKSKRLTLKKRNTLLESMTDEVAELVLRNNYLQTLAISLTQVKGMDDFSHQQRLMQALENRGLLDRVVENLPDDIMMAEKAQKNEPLTRAEIGVLLAYPKIVALDDLVASSVPDDPYLERELLRYFPTAMQNSYDKEIKQHRLRREIIATVLANSMINRGGPTFISRVENRTGEQTQHIANAYIAVRDAFGLQDLLGQIDKLDNKVSGSIQLELYAGVQERVLEQSVWFSRYGDFSKGIGPVVEAYGASVSALIPKLGSIIPEFLQNRIEGESSRMMKDGVPKGLAVSLAQLPIAALIPDIHLCSLQSGQKLDKSAKVFFAITEAFQIGRIVQAARTIDAEDFYDDLALDRALQSLNTARRTITVDILKSGKDASKWLDRRSKIVERTRNQMGEIIENEQATVSRLTVAANLLGDLIRAS